LPYPLFYTCKIISRPPETKNEREARNPPKTILWRGVFSKLSLAEREEKRCFGNGWYFPDINSAWSSLVEGDENAALDQYETNKELSAWVSGTILICSQIVSFWPNDVISYPPTKVLIEQGKLTEVEDLVPFTSLY
jgi:hypothetical protein